MARGEERGRKVLYGARDSRISQRLLRPELVGLSIDEAHQLLIASGFSTLGPGQYVATDDSGHEILDAELYRRGPRGQATIYLEPMREKIGNKERQVLRRLRETGGGALWVALDCAEWVTGFSKLKKLAPLEKWELCAEKKEERDTSERQLVAELLRIYDDSEDLKANSFAELVSRPQGRDFVRRLLEYERILLAARLDNWAL